MKIATWNVNSLKVRLPQVLKWLEENPVDVLCLQETKLTDDKFPAAEIAAAGYLVEFSGQKTYNGVAILSRHPMTDVVKNNPLFPDEQQRIIAYGGVVDQLLDKPIEKVRRNRHIPNSRIRFRRVHS